jgi:SAM-dependent methyltransferase
MSPSPAKPGYVFAGRGDEQRRLERQAQLFDPLTERVFLAAGLGPGMAVLDLGSGAGDVAMLAARIVGAAGSVLGVERDPVAVALATARAEQAGMPNVRFVEDDVQTLAVVEGEFDAITGRLVLMYLPDPPGALRRAIELLRPDALVCLQEGDMAYDWAEPMTPLWTQTRAWVLQTLELARVAPRMGLSLSSTFIAAGLPAPEMRLECAIGGGADARTWAWANVVRGMLPLMERLGVATTTDVQPDTLADRLLTDLLTAEGIVIGPPLVGAWAHTPTNNKRAVQAGRDAGVLSVHG